MCGKGERLSLCLPCSDLRNRVFFYAKLPQSASLTAPSSRDIESVAACGGNKQMRCRRLARRRRDGRSHLSFSSISPISAAALSAFFVYIGMQSRLFFGSLPYRESPVSVSAGMA